jgi:hypothetical protein
LKIVGDITWLLAINIIVVVNHVVNHSHEDMANVIPKKAIESLKISDL